MDTHWLSPRLERCSAGVMGIMGNSATGTANGKGDPNRSRLCRERKLCRYRKSLSKIIAKTIT